MNGVGLAESEFCGYKADIAAVVEILMWGRAQEVTGGKDYSSE